MKFGMRWVEMKEIVLTPECEENYFIFFAFTLFYFLCFIFLLFNFA